MARRKSKEQFIEDAKQVHGEKYDYSKVDYVNNYTKVCIICPEHGEFWQIPNNHINFKRGCPKCGLKQRIKTQTSNKETFVENANKLHRGKYDYSKVDYVNNHTKVCIICPEHGEFWQTPNSHLSGQNCPVCGNLMRSKKTAFSKEEFVLKAKLVHGEKYDYSKVDYINISTKICIICPKHGEFWQEPRLHLSGCGCGKCHQSKLEKEIEDLLIKNNIQFEYNKHYSFINNLQLDFFLPNLKIAIECQGLQHFKKGNWNKNAEINQKQFEKVVNCDNIKRQLCEENGIKLLYYSNLGIDYPYEVYENKEDILKIINGETN